MRNALVAFAVALAAIWLTVWAVFRTPSYAPLLPTERAAIVARVHRGESFPRPRQIVAGATFVREFHDRIKVDVVMARAPIPSWPAPLFALAIVPGVDGIGVDVADQEAFVLPDELM